MWLRRGASVAVAIDFQPKEAAKKATITPKFMRKMVSKVMRPCLKAHAVWNNKVVQLFGVAVLVWLLQC